MNMIFGIVALIAVVFGGGLAYGPSRELIKIKLGGLIGKSSTPAEKARQRYEDSKKRMSELNVKAARTMGQASLNKKDVEDRAADMKRLLAELDKANKLAASDKVKSAIATDFAKAKKAYADAQSRAEESANTAKEAQDSLEEIKAQLEEANSAIEGMENDHELADILKENAKLRQETSSMHSSLSDLSSSMRTGKRELEDARALNELTKGSSTDVERAKLARQSAADDALAEMQAMLGNKPAEVTVPATSAEDLLSKSAKG
jgi:uncharacterized phage infection (PIP) family protein YhgE